MASTMAFENIVDSHPVVYHSGGGRHLPLFAEATTPSAAEVTALTTGTWHLGWNANTWTPIPNFEEQWAIAQTTEARASLLDTYFPLASETLTHYQRSILMSITLPAKKSCNSDAELTFCNGTLRKRVCDFTYCVEDTSDGGGYWYCDACRNFANEQEQQQEDD